MSEGAAQHAAAIIEHLRAYRFRLNTERVLQDEMEEALRAGSFPVSREHRLPGAGIIDIMVGRVGIEAKIDGSKREIFRQCSRYCDHDDVGALILATNVALGLPRMAKPAFVLNLGRAWL